MVYRCLYFFNHYNYVDTNAYFVHVEVCTSCSVSIHLDCAEKLFGDRLVLVLYTRDFT